MRYFDETNSKKWDFAEAFQDYEKKNPKTSRRFIISSIKNDLERLQNSGGIIGEAALTGLKKLDERSKDAYV